MTVVFAELPDSPQETWDKDGLTATVRLMCNWDERNLLIIEKLLGAGELYPRIPGSLARARSGTAVPHPGQLTELVPGMASYEAAIVTIQYSTKGPDEEEPGVWYEETIEPTAEFQTLDYTGFRWTSGSGTAILQDEAPGKLLPGCDFKLSFPELTSIPAAVLALPGYVNASSYVSSLGLTLPAETLLFNLPVIGKTRKVDGTAAFKMDLRLTYKPNGWNKYWRASSTAYESIYVAGGGIYRSYPTGNFASIFS